MTEDLRPRTDVDLVPRPNKNFVVTPNEVKGFLPTASRRPDRFFYVLYGDTVLEWDGYRVGPVGAPDDDPQVNWSVLLVCPRCHNNLRLDSLQKHLEVESGAAGLQSEPIQCSYKVEFGTLCTWRVVLERPTKRHNRIVTVDGGRQIVIDAVARDAR